MRLLWAETRIGLTEVRWEKQTLLPHAMSKAYVGMIGDYLHHDWSLHRTCWMNPPLFFPKCPRNLSCQVCSHPHGSLCRWANRSI